MPANEPGVGWGLRTAALTCWIGSIVLAVTGLRLLFSGNWLESHDVKYGPLAVLVIAFVAAIAAWVLAIIGVVRRPRQIGSWLIAAIVLILLPVGLAASKVLGF